MDKQVLEPCSCSRRKGVSDKSCAFGRGTLPPQHEARKRNWWYNLPGPVQHETKGPLVQTLLRTPRWGQQGIKASMVPFRAQGPVHLYRSNICEAGFARRRNSQGRVPPRLLSLPALWPLPVPLTVHTQMEVEAKVLGWGSPWQSALGEKMDSVNPETSREYPAQLWRAIRDFSAEWRVQLVFRNNFLAAVWRMDWRAWRQKDQLEGYYVSSRVAFSFFFLNIKLPGRNRFYIYNAGQITHTNTRICVRISIWNPESTKHKALVKQCFTLLEAKYSDFTKKCWLHITIILSQYMKIKPSYCTPLTFI